MATITFGEAEVHTVGELPTVGSAAPPFRLTGRDFGEVTSDSLLGRRVVLNIFPSIATGVCSASVREFNSRAASLDDTTVVCVSIDLPFPLDVFCGAEGIDHVVAATAFRSPEFGDDFGVRLVDGKWAGLLSRAVVVIDRDGTVLYTEQVPAIGQEPDYDAALAAL